LASLAVVRLNTFVDSIASLVVGVTFDDNDVFSTGDFKYQEDIQRGFDNIPKNLLRLFHGKNLGKQLLKIADPS
jgi:NADPH-dependent curcumin reductase CurA